MDELVTNRGLPPPWHLWKPTWLSSRPKRLKSNGCWALWLAEWLPFWLGCSAN